MARVALAACCAGLVAGEHVEWLRFKETYGKSYGSAEEEARRLAQFELNLAEIAAENAKNHTYSLGITEFADESAEEFAATHLGLRMGGQRSGTKLGVHGYSGEELPSSVDWTEMGAVTPVKNQGTCGSCWSFSTTGALEGAWKLASGRLVSLSEEQFLDCSWANLGCLGGVMDKAFAFAEKNAVCTEASYPYKGWLHVPYLCLESRCDVGIPKGSVHGHKDVAHSESALMSAVATQPVSVSVDGVPWQHYRGGVFRKTCGTKLDHGVLAVGYGSDGATRYWKVKNSWGEKWGERGYIRVLRGEGEGGECGILLNPSYPVVSASETLV